jgi:hypothetical protein
MDNVLTFPTASKKAEPVSNPAMDYVSESLIPWAEFNNIDTSSMQFKLNAATILTCLQGMLLNNDI